MFINELDQLKCDWPVSRTAPDVRMWRFSLLEPTSIDPDPSDISKPPWAKNLYVTHESYPVVLWLLFPQGWRLALACHPPRPRLARHVEANPQPQLPRV